MKLRVSKAIRKACMCLYIASKVLIYLTVIELSNENESKSFGPLAASHLSWKAGMQRPCVWNPRRTTRTRFKMQHVFFFWILQIMQNKVGTSTTWTARDFAARLAALGWASRTTAGQTGRNGVGLREQWVGTENICIQFVSNVIWFLYIYTHLFYYNASFLLPLISNMITSRSVRRPTFPLQVRESALGELWSWGIPRFEKWSMKDDEAWGMNLRWRGWRQWWRRAWSAWCWRWLSRRW